MPDRPIIAEANRFAAWGADGELVALVADGPTATADRVAELEAELEAARAELAEEEAEPDAETPETPPPPAERTPADETHPAPEGSIPFTIPVCVLEGYTTSDDRRIAPDALGHRALPLSLMVMTRNPDGGWGHAGAFVGGRVDTLERYDAASTINPETGQPYGPGVFAWRATGYLLNTSAEEQETVRLVRDRVLTGVSVDVGEAVSEIEVIEEDEDGWPTRILETVTQGSLMGMTVCPFPAFPGAFIELDGEELEPVAASAMTPDALTASGVGVRILGGIGCRTCDDALEPVVAAGGPIAPPRTWFDDPQLDGPTPITVTDDGRVYGHVALWGTCHTGMQDRCVTPPRSRSGYALFHTGEVVTAEGDRVNVGQITLGTGHASTSLGLAATVAHYDHTGTAAVDVHLYEDAHGIVAAGAARSALSEEQVRALRAAAVSGDWRPYQGGLELVAVLSVNVPGFPVPRLEARVAGGAPTALVAAGVVTRPRREAGRTDVNAVVAAAMRPLLPIVRDHHLARLRRPANT